jgi:2-aminoadipate transaminase
VAGVSYQFAHRTRGLRSSAIRDLLKVTEMPHMLSLAGGLPTPDSFPLADLRREADRLLGEYGPRVVQYSATDGVPELRRWIAQHHSAEFGRPVEVEGEIVVTHGSQQALDLLAKVFIDPGDVVVSESPAYLGAVQSLELFEPRFDVIPGDKHGMQVELLAERLAAGLRPKLVYVVPNFHNPSGATLSLERRRLLAELADQYELLVVEDDPYGAIRFHGDPLPPVAAFSERVVHLSTFSNVVAPGFIDTPMTQKLNEAQRDALTGKIPLGRMGVAADVAELRANGAEVVLVSSGAVALARLAQRPPRPPPHKQWPEGA